jgi:hypothetical protein
MVPKGKHRQEQERRCTGLRKLAYARLGNGKINSKRAKRKNKVASDYEKFEIAVPRWRFH